MASPLEASVRQEGGVAVVDLRGEIDGGAEATLDAAYREAAAGGPVLLNFAGVDYINSTGIALIVGVLAEARRARKPLAACGLRDHFREIFEITRLADFIEIYPDEQSAVIGSAVTAGR